MLTFAAICIIIASLKLAADLLIPLLLAVFFAMALTPLAARLQRRGLSAVLATLLSFALGVVLVLGLGALIAVSLEGVDQKLPGYEARVKTVVNDATTWLSDHRIPVPKEGDQMGVSPGDLLQYTTSVVASLGTALSNAIVVLFVMLLLMLERAALTGEVRGQTADTPMQARIQRITQSITDYLSVKTLISLATGLLFGIACALIGVDFPILWGLLAFLFNYIPNIGSAIAAVPPIFVAWIQLGPKSALLVVVASLLVNGILGNVVEPKLMGKKVGLSTLTIFLGLIFWSWVFGPAGTILSVPLTLVAKMLLEKPGAGAQPPEVLGA